MQNEAPLLAMSASTNIIENGTAAEEAPYKVYPGRFYVLIAFALLAGQQALSWMTFGTIPNESYQHFGLTDDEVTLLSGKILILCAYRREELYNSVLRYIHAAPPTITDRYHRVQATS